MKPSTLGIFGIISGILFFLFGFIFLPFTFPFIIMGIVVFVLGIVELAKEKRDIEPLYITKKPKSIKTITCPKCLHRFAE